MSIALLRVNTDEEVFFGGAGLSIGELSHPSTSWGGLAIDTDGNAFILNRTSDYLSSVNLNTGAPTRVGLVSNFGASASQPQSLTFTENGTLYFIDTNRDRLYTMNTSTGRATQVGSLAAGFGISELAPYSLAAIENDLYMTGGSNNAIYEMNKTTGIASRIGDVARYGLGDTTNIDTTVIFSINDRMFMYSHGQDVFYEIDLGTGYATYLGESDISFSSAAFYNGVLYRQESNVLSRSNLLDLPVAVDEGVGTPVISRYSFPASYGNDAYSVSGKLMSTLLKTGC